MHSDSRIAIIGAGAAGLSAAWYLQQRGYRQVQLLEAEHRIGGKCYTITARGRSFDLGAFTITWGYKQTRRLAKTVGVPLVPQPERKVFDISDKWVGSIKQGLHRKHGMLSLVITSMRYVGVLWRYRRWLAVPGFAGVHEHDELTQPFAPWARERKLDPLIDMFRILVKDMGYGSLEEIPTIYVIKYLHFWNFLTLSLYTVFGLRRWPKRFRYGFGRLWEAVAVGMEVETGVDIKAIRRHASGVSIQIQGESAGRDYDAVIITCPPSRLASIMDCSPEEQALFSKVRTTRYCSSLCRVEGMPAEIYNATDDDPLQDYLPGHPWEMMRAWPDNDHATFYAMLDDGNDLQAVQKHIATDLNRLFGARLVEVVEQREWAYFPHFPQDEMKAGIFDSLEALQGQKNCYYSGGLFAFETVENVVAYSQTLIDKHFPQQYRQRQS